MPEAKPILASFCSLSCHSSFGFLWVSPAQIWDLALSVPPGCNIHSTADNWYWAQRGPCLGQARQWIFPLESHDKSVRFICSFQERL